METEKTEQLKSRTRASERADLTQGSIWDKVLRFAVPLALTSMLQQLFNAADVAVVGRFASKYAMAAVGCNSPVISLLVNFFVGISVGANVVIARNIGAKNHKRANQAVHTSLVLALICGVLVAVLGNIIAKPIVGLLDVPDDVAGYAVTYLRIYFAGAPFILFYNYEAAIFRAGGNTKMPLYALFFGGLLNVAANLFFVIVLKMDVDGVAIATVLSNVVSSLILLHFLRRETGAIRVNLSELRINRPALRMMLKIGLPSALHSMVFSIYNLCVQSAINSLGANVMAASSAAFNLEIFIFYIINAYSQTMTTFIGQNYGAGDKKRCRECVKQTMLISWTTTMAASILLLVFMRPLLGLFTTEAAIIDIACIRVRVLMYSETLNVVMDNLSGALRGLGNSLAPALIALVGVCGTRITWVYTGFKVFHTFTSLMLVFPISWALCAAVIVFVYFRERKRILL